ncbi:hypothetical protein RB653_007534 [Dictyostelium firmibasis]|uniref:Carbohydrate kinase PfkB domain-containing protein n=1 Tax=Dictyostelium firmibasis TaxID=79012 RepID=A0AAN7TLZ7_9MYCE
MNTKNTTLLIIISIIISYFSKIIIDYYLTSDEFKDRYSLFEYVIKDKIIQFGSDNKNDLFDRSAAAAAAYHYNEEMFYNIKISKEVEDALRSGKPIVSLESTIISHGMPYPQNYETALEVESIVRSYGVVPATIAILNGTIHIGLTEKEIHYLATVGKDAIKTSRRDIAMVTSMGKTGSTTVSATILFSNLVGIKVFVTGGLGGVHRGAETSLDISADLTELGKNGVMVVSAGVKSILDIQKTLEYLETQGVTVVTYGSDEFPAFFTQHSGVKTPNRLDTIEQCAKLLYSNQLLQLKSGMVIAVPPRENEHSELIDRAIKESIEQSIVDGILGKDITPYLLKKVNEKTGGKSLESNIELVKNNARIGSQISKHYYNLLKNKQSPSSGTNSGGIKGDELVFNYFDQRVNSFLRNYFLTSDILLLNGPNRLKGLKGPKPNKQLADNHIEYDIVVVGGAVIDMISHPFKESGFQMETSNPGAISIKMGGVGRNVAEVLSRLQMNSLFISLLGDDVHSGLMLESFQTMNLSLNGVGIKAGSKTAIYNAIMNDRGDLAVAIAQMEIFDEITPSYISKFDLTSSKLLVFDGNIPTESMTYLAQLSRSKGIKLWFEPTSVYKSSKIVEPFILSSITYISPNRDELIKISNEIIKKGLIKFENIITNDINDLENIKKHSIILIESGIKYIITKMGSKGVLLAYKKDDGEFKFELFSAPEVPDNKIVDVTGAGDSLVGCSIYSILQGHNLTTAIPQYGTLCAKESLLSTNPVSPNIKVSLFK